MILTPRGRRVIAVAAPIAGAALIGVVIGLMYVAAIFRDEWVQ